MDTSELGKQIDENIVYVDTDYIDLFPKLKLLMYTNPDAEDGDLDLSDFAQDVHSIQSLDAAYFAMRRLPYVCGSVVDSLRSTRNKLIKKLEEKHKIEYDDPNTDVDY